MSTKTFNPPVLLTKSVLLQRCADLVRLGSCFHVSGVVPYDRAPALARKFRDTYLVHLGKDARYRRRRAGLGNAHLLLWMHDPCAYELTFVLLVTHGDHPAHQLERLRDARGNGRERIEITGYELVRRTRTGSTKPVWTWQMTAECYQRWRDRALRVIRIKNDLELRQAWYSLHKVPGFSRIREQAKSVERLMKCDWTRSRRGEFPFSHTRIRYVQRLAVKSKPLSAVLAAPRVSGQHVAIPKETITLTTEHKNHHD